MWAHSLLKLGFSLIMVEACSVIRKNKTRQGTKQASDSTRFATAALSEGLQMKIRRGKPNRVVSFFCVLCLVICSG